MLAVGLLSSLEKRRYRFCVHDPPQTQKDDDDDEPEAGEAGTPAAPARLSTASRPVVLTSTPHRATTADNALLVDLMAQVPMSGELVLSTRRDPDFFALYNIQRGEQHAFVLDTEGFQGVATALTRDGYLDGAAARVGYLGDLRIRGRGRARREFPLLFARYFDEVCATSGCEAYVTAVLRDNQLALASLTSRKARRTPQPFYAPLRTFDMVSVQCVWRKRVRTPSGLTVQRATPDDVPALSAFLDADHKTRPFGYRFDDGELVHRLRAWPGFTLEDTFVVRAESTGDIVGTCTVWDAAPVKRYRVQRYGGGMRALKLAVRCATAFTGGAALPAVGSDFRSLYLTNLAVKDDHPAVFEALLSHAYALAWERRVHFFSFPLYENDALAPAVRGYLTQRVPFALYAVTRSAVARTAWPGGRPGFEMALA